MFDYSKIDLSDILSENTKKKVKNKGHNIPEKNLNSTSHNINYSDFTPGVSKVGPGVLNNDTGIQGVTIKEGNFNPYKEMELANKEKEQYKIGQMLANYDNWISKGNKGEDFIKNLTPKNQEILHNILQQRLNIPKEPSLYPAEKFINNNEKQIFGYLKTSEQNMIADNEESLPLEFGKAIGKGIEGIGESLAGFGENVSNLGKKYVTDKIVNPENYDKQEVYEATKNPTFNEGGGIKYNVEQTLPFHYTDLGTQRFWVDLVGQQIPQVGAGIATGMGGAKIGTNIASKLNVNKIGEGIFELGGMVIGNTTFNSIQNGGQTYWELKNAGATDDEASKGANEVFYRTLATSLTNLPEFAQNFSKFKLKIPKSATYLGTALTEGGEELYEQGIQADVYSKIINGKPLNWNEFIKSPEGQQSFIAGFLGGAMFSGAGHINDKIKETFKKGTDTYSNMIIDYAKKGDDSFIDKITALQIKGDIGKNFGDTLKDLYIETKNFLKDKTEQGLEKFAEKTGGKINFLPNDFNINNKEELDFTDKKIKNILYKNLEQLRSLQLAKDKQGKFNNIDLKQDFEELGLNPNDFYDTQDLQTKTEIIKDLQKLGAIDEKGQFTEKLYNAFGGKGKFQNTFKGLGKGVHIPKIKKIDDKKIKEIEKKFNIPEGKCKGTLCGKKAVENYINNGEKGEIKKGIFIKKEKKPNGEYINYKEALEIAKNRIKLNKGRPYHYWHQIGNKISPDITEGKTGKRINELNGWYIPMGKIETEKQKTFIDRNKEKVQIEKLAKKFEKIVSDPKTEYLEKVIKNNGKQILSRALNFAQQKNMISKEGVQEIKEIIDKKYKGIEKAPVGTINEYQKNVILDMLGWDKLLKRASDFKINVRQLAESLKKIGARLHLVNAPGIGRVKLPFSLMGNKSATFHQILLPLIKKATNRGAEIYVEPFGGAGTVYYFADEMIKSGIKELHINHFDNEKYQVIKAIKEGKIKDIDKEVDEAYGKVIDEISEELVKIPELKEIMDEYGVKVGDKTFKELAEIAFYPQYAKQFFEERPDTKLAIKGELTESFKSWLKEHIQKENEKQGIEMTDKELDEAVKVILSQDIFEKKYPKISKSISDKLNKIDDVNIKDGDYKKAMLVAMARHFRQRGDSGQKVVSAVGGIQELENIPKKMKQGLLKYKQVFDKHGYKIHIYNQDGKKFIAEMGSRFNSKKTISYFDPPYIRTTGVYIKNQPKEIQNSLEEYANPEIIDRLFSPLKDTIMMFTNDIDGKYFETLYKMLGDRFNKDIIGYREGTTPTSLITTTEIKTDIDKLGLDYYTILKDKFTSDIYKSLKEHFLPKIAKQMEKHLAKFEQHFVDLMNKKFGDLRKIQDKIFKGKEAFEKLEDSLENIVSGKDKQKIINEAKKWLKQNSVTGIEVSKMIDKVNKLYQKRLELIKNIKEEVNKLKKAGNIDIESKKLFFDWFNEKYTTKNISEDIKKDIKIIDKILNGKDFTTEEYKIFDKYLKDEKFYNKIEAGRKTIIRNQDIEELEKILDTIKYYKKVGMQLRQKNKDLLYKKVEQEYNLAKDKVKKIENTGMIKLSESFKKENRLLKFILGVKKLTKQKIIDANPSTWTLDEELNIYRNVYNIIEKPINNYRDEIGQILEEFDKLEKELKLTKEDYEKIAVHGLAKRSDKKGVIKLIARMKKDGTKEEDFAKNIENFKSANFLNEKQKKMYNFMQENFKKLGKKMQEVKAIVDNELVELQDEYFPIRLDFESNKDKLNDDPTTIDNGGKLFKTTKTEQGFTKKATGLEVVPDIRGDVVFKQHINNVSYYNNMQLPIKQLNELVKKLGKEKLGDLGYTIMKDYIDILSRQGYFSAKTGLDKFIATQIRHFQSAVLAFNPTTTLLQTSAIPEYLAVGGKIKTKAIKDIIKIVVGKKEIWDMITEKSGTIRNREYRNLFGNTTDKWDKGIFEKWNKYGFWGIQKMDAVLSRVLWYSTYIEEKQKGISEEEAIYEADTIVKKAMGHTHFEGKSPFVLKNERNAGAIFTLFQNFVLNHYAMMRYAGGKKIKERYGKNFGFMLSLFFSGVLFSIWEALIRKLGDKIHNRESKTTPEEATIQQLISFIPYLSIMWSNGKYGTTNIVQGWKDLQEGLKGDWEKVLKGFGFLLGIGGTAEFDRIYKGYFKEKRKQKREKVNYDLNLYDLDVNDLEFNLNFDYSNININDL